MAKDEYDFTSTNLQSGAYDEAEKVMEITFNSGRTYQFDRVDPVMWDRLKSAPSAGRFLRENFGTGREI